MYPVGDRFVPLHLARGNLANAVHSAGYCAWIGQLNKTEFPTFLSLNLTLRNALMLDTCLFDNQFHSLKGQYSIMEGWAVQCQHQSYAAVEP